MAKQAAEEAEGSDQLSSDDWFDLGVDLEAVSPEDAPAAYLRALELDPYHSDAHVNLGRLLQEAGEYEAAEEHYNRALDAEPDNVLAAFNMGTLFEDMGRVQDAITAYKRATNLADAHYNLSRLYELVGEHAEAGIDAVVSVTVLHRGQHALTAAVDVLMACAERLHAAFQVGIKRRQPDGNRLSH